VTWWEFCKERWGFVLWWALGWQALCIWVLPRLPSWASIAAYGIAGTYLAYHWGTLNERRRCTMELLAAREAHAADLERFCAYLAQERVFMDQIKGVVEQVEAAKGAGVN